MLTKEIIASEIGFVSDSSYESAVKKMNEIGFLVKEENERNPVILDWLSTYIDQCEKERWEAYELIFKACEVIDTEFELDRTTINA